MANYQYANNPSTTLSGSVTAGATTINVVSASGFPALGNFTIIVDSEIMLVTGVSGTMWTVSRGAENTSAASHNNNATVTGILTKHSFLNVKAKDVRTYGATGDGSTDDTTAIQAALDAAGEYGRVYLPGGVYKISSTLTFQNGQMIEGQSGGPQVLGTNRTRLLWAGGASPMLSPLNSTSDTVNVKIVDLGFDGNATATVGINFTRVSYGRITRCGITSMAAASGKGVLLDANTTGQCYFNVLEQLKLIAFVGVYFSRGANSNQVIGGAAIGCGTALYFDTASSVNTVIGMDIESSVTQAVYLDASGNQFFGVHIEGGPIGFNITSNGSSTSIFGAPSYSGTTTPISAAASIDLAIHELRQAGKPRWQNGLATIQGDWTSGNTPMEFDAMPFNGTAISQFKFFKNTTTSGTRIVDIYKGDGTGTVQIRIDAANRKINFDPATLGITIQVGTGSPEGSVTAQPGSLYLNSSGGAGTTLYVKQSGTGNTGWIGK